MEKDFYCSFFRLINHFLFVKKVDKDEHETITNLVITEWILCHFSITFLLHHREKITIQMFFCFVILKRFIMFWVLSKQWFDSLYICFWWWLEFHCFSHLVAVTVLIATGLYMHRIGKYKLLRFLPYKYFWRILI